VFQLILTTSELLLTVIDEFETTVGALTYVEPVGILSTTTVVPPFCRYEGMSLMTTFTEPVTPPSFPTTKALASQRCEDGNP
jgi:hypothetical protein